MVDRRGVEPLTSAAQGRGGRPSSADSGGPPTLRGRRLPCLKRPWPPAVRSAHLRVRFAAGDLRQVHGDEVVRVRLGLRAGGELLAGVLLHGGELRALDRRAPFRREEDLLRCKLLVYLVVHKGVAPDEQASQRQQDDRDDESRRADQQVESSAVHGVVSQIDAQAWAPGGVARASRRRTQTVSYTH